MNPPKTNALCARQNRLAGILANGLPMLQGVNRPPIGARPPPGHQRAIPQVFELCFSSTLAQRRLVFRLPLLVTMFVGGSITAVRTSLPLSTTTMRCVSMGAGGRETVMMAEQSGFSW